MAVGLAVLLLGAAGCSTATKSASTTGSSTSTSPTPAGGSTTSVPPGSTTSTPPTTLPGPAGGPVPAGFAASSVTFVSTQVGWVLGTAPCGSPPCTSVLRTRDAGRTWMGIPAPRTALTSGGGAGVRRIRFADPLNGWAFGPELWATHDGGAHWTRITLPGLATGAEVSDLAAAAGTVHVSAIDPSGVSLLSSPVGTDTWTASPTKVQIGAGPVPQAQIVLQGKVGWMVEVDRTVIGGARLANGSWTAWTPPCEDAGGPLTLAASTATDLFAVCDEGVWIGGGPISIRAYLSGDGGGTFRQATGPLPLRSSGDVASGGPSAAVTAGGGSGADAAAVLLATFDAGTTWASVYKGQPTGGFQDLGFTSASQGVAVESTTAGTTGRLLMTVDGGHTWQTVPFA